MKKLRVGYVVIQPILMWDDGKELSPGPQVNPVQLKVSELDGIKNRLLADVAAQEAALAEPKVQSSDNPSSTSTAP